MEEVGWAKGPFQMWDRRMWLIAIPIAAIVLATFWPVTHNDFVNWDDPKNFLTNPHYRGLGWAQLRWAWTTFLFGVYQPIAWMLLELQYSMFALDPRGYHLVSVLLHVINSVVLYVLTIALIGRANRELLEHQPWRCYVSAGIVTALFAIHPLRTEVVAWVSSQPYLMCALFYLLAIASYLRANPQYATKDARWLLASYLFFIAGLLSKAVAVSLPFVLLILDVYPLHRLSGGPWRWFAPPTRRVWLEKLPFLGASLVFMLVAMAARRHEEMLATVQANSLLGQMARALSGAGFHVVKTLMPVRITAFYVVPIGVAWLRPEYFVYILTALVISGTVFLLRRSAPAAMAAWAIYLIILGPNLGLVRISNQLTADRYGYVPLMALFACGAASLAWSWSRPRLLGITTLGLVPIMVAVLVILIGLTQIQAQTWRTSIALWTHAVGEGQGDSAEVQTLLGLAFVDESRWQEAKEHFIGALRVNANYSEAHNNLGTVLIEEGRLSEAEEQFRESLRLNPENVQAHNNMGLVFLRRRQVERAISQYARALEVEPDNAPAATNLRRILVTTPPRDARLVNCVEAVLRDPTDAPAYRTLADALKPYE